MAIENVLKESRVFPPPEAFQRQAAITSLADYEKLWKFSVTQPEEFWQQQAETLLSWNKRWQEVCVKGGEDRFSWFVGGTLNASFNCVDRHATGKNATKMAIIWEGEPGEQRKFTYRELHAEVCRFAHGLQRLGIVKGDVVTLYMPMIPELVFAMLACARIGAMHNVIFGGFSAEAVADRNNDCKAKLVVTADGGFRKGKVVPLKEVVDEALRKSPSVKKVLVIKRTGTNVLMDPNRDFWWHELREKCDAEFPPEQLDSEHPLFLLYTSGSTGKPKGILHTTAGYLLGATLSTKFVFDLKPQDVFWCTADIGWVTGHSYVVYGPLANGATVLIYEGAPNEPDWGRFWGMIERHRVTKFYTAPTAIRTFMRSGREWPEKYDLSSLQLLGTVGEPINPEAWMWYHEVIGKQRCPIVDTWWQTETGSIMITPLPGATPTRPGSATRPFFGVDPAIVDEDGEELPANQGGFLVIRKPWPSMLRTVYGDHPRYQKQYWSQIPGSYFTGDGARCDEHGNFWIMGRIDDVLNVSGHRLSTMEIESALVCHPAVAEAAVVGRPDPIKGEAIACFVILSAKAEKSEREHLKDELKAHVVKQIGALARPDDIRFTAALPKTRSGKIMRRLLRNIAMGKEVQGDLTTIEDKNFASLIE